MPIQWTEFSEEEEAEIQQTIEELRRNIYKSEERKKKWAEVTADIDAKRVAFQAARAAQRAAAAEAPPPPSRPPGPRYALRGPLPFTLVEVPDEAAADAAAAPPTEEKEKKKKTKKKKDASAEKRKRQKTR